MRGLFIAEKMFVRESGSKLMEESYYQCLCETIGKENLDAIAIKNSWQEGDDRFICLDRKKDILTFLSGYSAYLDRNGIKFILKRIEKEKYDFVFFMSQAFGKLIKVIKKRFPQVVTITYYPGISMYHRKSISYYHPPIKEYVGIFNAVYNERLCTKYCDVRILLNERENENLYKYYKTHATDIIPIFIKDAFNGASLPSIPVMSSENYNLLFVGTFFPPNIYGVKWFVKNVMPELPEDVHLYVVGSDMDKLAFEFSYDQSRVHIMGRVPSLEDYYNSADLVVEPIFHGDGMKSKTAEALMYGKIVVGTKEALMGYSKEIDTQCDTKDEYINTIMKYKNDFNKKYSERMRRVFLDNHSMNAGVKCANGFLHRYFGDK